ncbi:MAG: molybdenum cofactor guanylyltransferase [Verrucomicrobia bacterium]|jgi:molybdenum cofactor guanylyltransferase|nr:molybdenum cofactor guanylyltransferase [Verrucomicrobiota bacterium]MBT7067840.1 molybdenum cofactor guanylyltransferase [Verrucomicrobiota bacterium]MBT7699314.1 molybdenum cofactor guanylyltransferase [Verrucomicrobiota bacterium]
MLKAPNMLLIGSTGRNIGKTELACSIVRRLRPEQPVGAVKITVIREEDGRCPRGGEGCGACTSLEGDYDLMQETNRDGVKDTSRLLLAGADPAFWLRVRASHMKEGLDRLYTNIDPHTPLVCESNSIRNAVAPGLFLMVQDSRSSACKPTARAVAHLVDRTIISDGEPFDLDLARITHGRNGWRLRRNATAIILAGGQSSRMGQDKSMLTVDGRPLIQHVHEQLEGHFDEILLSSNDARHAFLELKTVRDRQADQGPLMGIASALEVASHDLVFVTACDMPDIDIHLAHRMLSQAEGYDAVVPRSVPPGSDTPRPEPLCAVYRRDAAGRMFELLARGERRIRSFFDQADIRYVDLDPQDAPRNLNTEEEYRAYVSRTGRHS